MAERSLVDRLPSPGGAALWLYALVFVLVPMLLAWKGFAYIVGVVIFAVGLRPHVVALAEGRNFSFGMRRRGRSPPRTRRVVFASEKSRWCGWSRCCWWRSRCWSCPSSPTCSSTRRSRSIAS